MKDDLLEILGEYLSLSMLELEINQNELDRFIKGFTIYGLDYEFESSVIVTNNFELIKDEIELEINYDILIECVKKKYSIYSPTLLVKKIDDLTNQLNDYNSLKIKFLSTSRLFEKQEISKGLSEMITNSKDHIYMMLSFYQEDILFFSDFLVSKILESGIEFKVIYNSNDPKNEEFIRRVMKGIGGDTNFFRSYSWRLLKTPVKKFVGNLHSKSVITESELLVGSANLTSQSMLSNVENAIYTNHKVSVKVANEFFLSLWNELRSPNAL